jgi:hypothetical protein
MSWMEEIFLWNHQLLYIVSVATIYFASLQGVFTSKTEKLRKQEPNRLLHIQSLQYTTIGLKKTQQFRSHDD